MVWITAVEFVYSCSSILSETQLWLFALHIQSYCLAVFTTFNFTNMIICDWLCQNPLHTHTHNSKVWFSLSISSFINKLTNYCNTSQKLTDLLAWSLLWLTTPSCTIITNIRCINIHSTSTMNKHRLYQQGFW